LQFSALVAVLFVGCNSYNTDKRGIKCCGRSSRNSQWVGMGLRANPNQHCHMLVVTDLPASPTTNANANANANDEPTLAAAND